MTERTFAKGLSRTVYQRMIPVRDVKECEVRESPPCLLNECGYVLAEDMFMVSRSRKEIGGHQFTFKAIR